MSCVYSYEMRPLATLRTIQRAVSARSGEKSMLVAREMYHVSLFDG